MVFDGDGFPQDVQQVHVQGDDAANVITVALAGGTYTVSDTTGATAGAGCTQAGVNAVTCPAAGIRESYVEPGAGDDRVTGSSGPDTILGGPDNDVLHGGPSGSDIVFGNEGNDLINSGGGGIPVTDPPCATLPIDGELKDPRTTWCKDSLNGGTGFDTVTYADRVGRVEVDLRPSFIGANDDDGTSENIRETEKVEGGLAGDELVGGTGPDAFDGGPGDAPDTICGGLGKDTVDYSDARARDGHAGRGAPDRSGHHRHRLGDVLGARRDCRPTIKRAAAAAPGCHG